MCSTKLQAEIIAHRMCLSSDVEQDSMLILEPMQSVHPANVSQLDR